MFPVENEPLTVRIPPALKARLLDLASANDVSAGSYVTAALEQWFASREGAPTPTPAPAQASMPPSLQHLLAGLPPSLAQLAELVRPEDLAIGDGELPEPMLIDWNARAPYQDADEGELSVTEGPVEFEGTVLRAVQRGGIIRAEFWEDGRWQRGGSLEDILWGTPLPREQLDEAGNPR